MIIPGGLSTNATQLPKVRGAKPVTLIKQTGIKPATKIYSPYRSSKFDCCITK